MAFLQSRQQCHVFCAIFPGNIDTCRASFFRRTYSLATFDHSLKLHPTRGIQWHLGRSHAASPQSANFSATVLLAKFAPVKCLRNARSVRWWMSVLHWGGGRGVHYSGGPDRRQRAIAKVFISLPLHDNNGKLFFTHRLTHTHTQARCVCSEPARAHW